MYLISQIYYSNFILNFSLTIFNCIFKNIHIEQPGGAILLEKIDFFILTNSFFYNISAKYAGALYINGGDSILSKNCFSFIFTYPINSYFGISGYFFDSKTELNNSICEYCGISTKISGDSVFCFYNKQSFINYFNSSNSHSKDGSPTLQFENISIDCYGNFFNCINGFGDSAITFLNNVKAFISYFNYINNTHSNNFLCFCRSIYIPIISFGYFFENHFELNFYPNSILIVDCFSDFNFDNFQYIFNKSTLNHKNWMFKYCDTWKSSKSYNLEGKKRLKLFLHIYLQVIS